VKGIAVAERSAKTTTSERIVKPISKLVLLQTPAAQAREDRQYALLGQAPKKEKKDQKIEQIHKKVDPGRHSVSGSF
jgi:hypothetical protein